MEESSGVAALGVDDDIMHHHQPIINRSSVRIKRAFYSATPTTTTFNTQIHGGSDLAVGGLGAMAPWFPPPDGQGGQGGGACCCRLRQAGEAYCCSCSLWFSQPSGNCCLGHHRCSPLDQGRSCVCNGVCEKVGCSLHRMRAASVLALSYFQDHQQFNIGN